MWLPCSPNRYARKIDKLEYMIGRGSYKILIFVR